MADTPRETTRKNWLWLVLIAAVVLVAVVDHLEPGRRERLFEQGFDLMGKRSGQRGFLSAASIPIL